MKTIYRSTLVQGVCYFLLIGGLLAPPAEAVKFRTEAGQLQQSKFVIAIPESWNGKLLLLAPRLSPPKMRP